MSLGCPTLTTEHAHAIVASSREHNTPVVRGRSVWLLVRLPGHYPARFGPLPALPIADLLRQTARAP
eukprot:2406999-Pyramimonas_sp.AAC.1